MAWVKLDDKFAQHPKVLQAGPLGLALYVAGLCYANMHLTDGFLPERSVPMLLNFNGLAMGMWNSGAGFGGGEDATWDKVAADLVIAELWERVEGGWMIHDYLQFQPSKDQVLSTRHERQVAGSKGGLAKAQQNSSKMLANGQQNPSNGVAKVCPVPVPVPLPQKNEEVKTILNGLGKKNGGTSDMPDTEKVARFQQRLARALGSEGWAIIVAACTRSDPSHERSLALCKETARSLNKGWPRQWPIQ